MNRTLSLVAALAFAAAASCFLLPFFTVGLGETGTVPLRGIGLVLGTVVPAPSSVAMDTTAVLEDPPSGSESDVDDASSDDPTAEARRFLHERQQPSTVAAPAPAAAKVTAPANVRSLMAIAILALAIAGLAASLVAQRLARFLAAVCAIGALVCAAFLLIGARDLPVVAIIQRAMGQTATGAIHVEAAAGYWALLGCLALATVASALGLRPALHVAQGPATPQAAPRAPRPNTGMRTYSASKNTARPVQPAPPPGSAATSAASPAAQPMNGPPPSAPANPISPTTMVPDEPGNGPGTPPPPQGGWSFANTPPAEPSQNDPPEKGSDAQGTPLSTWSFASGGQPRTPEPPPPPPSQPPPSRRTAHSGSQDSWSFGGGTPPQPPVSPPPPPQPPSSGRSSSGTGGGRPPEPPRPPVPPPPPPPPRYSAPPPPPPPSHDQDPMEPQDPYRQPRQQGANVFTGFARPYFDVIDSGALYRKPFFVLYTVFAVLNLLSILGVLGFMFKGGVTLIVTGLFMIFALWIGFQLWWNRREKVNSFVTHGSEFVALPVFSHLFQTIGEWTGTFVAIAGTGASLGGLIGSIGSESRGYGHGNPMAEFGNLGVAGLIACPIAGFLILILSRAFAEQIRALVAVANNTRNIERNTAR